MKCYICEKKFEEFEAIQKLKFSRDDEVWYNFVCQKCFYAVIKKVEGFQNG